MSDCKYKKQLSDAGFCKIAGYYCTAQMESNCKIKHDEMKTMPNEMNPQEVAERLEKIAKFYGGEAIVKLFEDETCVIRQAAADERRIANGELVEVVHAQWIKHADGSVTCLHCRRRMSQSAYGWPRCPNCGALMDGKDDNHETN